MWLALASILHLFNISKVMDAQGRDIEPEVHYGSGLVRYKIFFLLIGNGILNVCILAVCLALSRVRSSQGS